MDTITEIQKNLNFWLDALHSLGFNHGYATVIENIEQIADSEWNSGNKEIAEYLRNMIKKLQGEDENEELG